MTETRQQCGQAAPDGSGRVCERWQGHDGEHRGYFEQIDEPIFWSSRAVEYGITPASLVREVARDIDFAIDVTEPREVLLARFETILTAYSVRLRLLTVHETIDSMRSSGWLSDEDYEHVKATLEEPK